MKSGNLNFLEHSGPLQGCNGSALPLPRSTLETGGPLSCYRYYWSRQLFFILSQISPVHTLLPHSFHQLQYLHSFCSYITRSFTLHSVKAQYWQLQSFLTSAIDAGEGLTSLLSLFTAWNIPRYPLIRRLVGAHSRSERFGEEVNLLPLVGFEPRIVQLHRLRSNIVIRTRILLNHLCINTVRNSYMFQLLKGNLQAVQLIQSCSVGQGSESLVVNFSVVCMCTVYCVCVQCTVYVYSVLCMCTVYCVCVQCTVYVCTVLCMCAVYCVCVECTVYVCSVLCMCAVYCVCVQCTVYVYSVLCTLLRSINMTCTCM
jgi:hypothetical protein